MIGNLPFAMPFFTANVYPMLVAAPFVLVTFLASPASPFKSINRGLKGLSDITEEGHHLGLVFYAVSYTVLAVFFGRASHVMAAGILPMAYGDSVASLVGQRWGKRRYKLVSEKSLEGSAVMFLASFVSLGLSIVFFCHVYSFSVLGKILPVLGASVVATLVEGVSPLGFDNLTVPSLSALTFYLLSGGL